MLHFRVFIIFGMLLASAVACKAKAVASEPNLQSGGSPAFQVAELQDQLEKGLKARRPVEFEFIEKVVEMVEADQLPLELVTSTFQWARRKKPYPFPYFERGLRIRAEKLGIEI